LTDERAAERAAGRDTGTADLVAGAAGGLFAPVATFGLGIPFWLAIPLAVLVFFGVRLALAPRRLFEGFRFGEIDQASLALARDVLEQAHGELDALAEAASAVKNTGMRGRLMHLHGIAAKVIDEVEQKPRRIGNVRRLLTYYLPGAVRLAAGYQALEGQLAPSRERLAATERMIGQLDGVFSTYADKLTAEEVEGLDLEIKLLEGEISGERKT
jgi:5-bromo-4-chloroindolyl phosphate hydrolysis protein